MKRYIKSDDNNNTLNVFTELGAFNTCVGDRREFALRTKCPELLDIYQFDPAWQVRAAVAVNSATPEEILANLASDIDWTVRLGVAKHSNTSNETLRKLAEDQDNGVAYEAKTRLGYFR